MIRSTLFLDGLERLSVSNRDWITMAMISGYSVAPNTN